MTSKKQTKTERKTVSAKTEFGGGIIVPAVRAHLIRAK